MGSGIGPCELSEKEVKIIKESWKIPMEHIHDTAEIVFYTFLERYPQYMQTFPAFRGKILTELKGTPRFRAHSSRIFSVLSSVVDTIKPNSSNYEVKMFVAEYGVSHARRKIKRQPYEDLKVVAMEILTSACQLNDEGIVAWNKYFNLLYGVFFECIDGNIDQFM